MLHEKLRQYELRSTVRAQAGQDLANGAKSVFSSALGCGNGTLLALEHCVMPSARHLRGYPRRTLQVTRRVCPSAGSWMRPDVSCAAPSPTFENFAMYIAI